MSADAPALAVVGFGRWGSRTAGAVRAGRQEWLRRPGERAVAGIALAEGADASAVHRASAWLEGGTGSEVLGILLTESRACLPDPTSGRIRALCADRGDCGLVARLLAGLLLDEAAPFNSVEAGDVASLLRGRPRASAGVARGAHGDADALVRLALQRTRVDLHAAGLGLGVVVFSSPRVSLFEFHALVRVVEDTVGGRAELLPARAEGWDAELAVGVLALPAG